jgi:hypothetical protein
MSQQELFFESVLDALGSDIAAAGGFKTVASKLWPAESLTTSAARLRNALNPEQPQKLCPEEVLQIKRLAYEVGATATVDFEAQQLGYVCTWVDPEDESEQLGREIRDLLEAVNRKLDRKAKAEERAGLRSVK